MSDDEHPEQQAATIDPPRAVRIKTSTGWANLAIAGTPGYPDTTGKINDVLTVVTDGAAPAWKPPAPQGAQITYVGQYDPAHVYHDGDYVVDANGMTYQCVVEGTTGIAPVPWSSGVWVQLPNVVNGQWVKGVGGSAVWSAISVADVAGAEATANKNVNGGYVGRDASGNAAIPGSLSIGPQGRLIFNSTNFGGVAVSCQIGQYTTPTIGPGITVPCDVTLLSAWPNQHLVFMANVWPNATWDGFVCTGPGYPLSVSKGTCSINCNQAQSYTCKYVSFGY